ncbi:MAG: hypothetical protein ACRDHW_17675 [Ktedonobacteraceae bacterium]
MFFWKGRQAIFLLVMLVVCAMALTHPSWRHWYEMIVPPLLIFMAILALDYAMRK